jgi:hypothetical protein
VIGDDALTLSDEQLERLAELLAIKLAAVRPAVPSMLTVEDICNAFQVSRAWVYDNAGRLGGIKLGSGQRGPLRFPPNRVAEALKPLVTDPAANPPAPGCGAGEAQAAETTAPGLRWVTGPVEQPVPARRTQHVWRIKGGS